MNNKTNLLSFLHNVFINNNICGKGDISYILNMKNEYYKQNLDKLSIFIDNLFINYQHFRDEILSLAYDFFSNQLDKYGFILINPHEMHLSNNQDIYLLWHFNNSFYIKTDKIFINKNFKFKNYNIFFDFSNFEYKKANEFRKNRYELKQIENNNITFYVFYDEKSIETDVNNILSKLHDAGIDLDLKDLSKIFKLIEKQDIIDLFIHKNTKDYLIKQFNLWLADTFFNNCSLSNNDFLKLTLLKSLVYELINIISEFENKLLSMWNSARFIKSINYVISIDKLYEKGILNDILNHKNFYKQIEEWKSLGLVDDNFSSALLIINNSLNKKYRFLPIDTKYFKDLELKILSLFDNLDEEIDGWLIKSENYQALNTILPKFKGKIQTIYIDPPFNKKQNADYLYSVKFKDSTWATMLENRINLSKNLLKSSGNIFVRCDYTGNWIARAILNEIFGHDNFKNEIVIKRGEVPKGEVNKLLTGTDSLLYFSVTKNSFFTTPMKKREKIEWLEMHLPGERTDIKLQIRKFFERSLLPPKGRHWALSQEKIDEAINNNRIRINTKKQYIDLNGNLVNGVPEIKQNEYQKINSNWTDISSYYSNNIFKTRNSEKLLSRVIQSTSNKGDLIMDFFLGSGTTTATAHKLKRKWIGIEMGEHFYTIALPRMKKVLFYDKSEISLEMDVKKIYNKNNAGGMFKYYELSQLEDTLDKNFINELYKLFSDCVLLSELLSLRLGKYIKNINSNKVIFHDETFVDFNDYDFINSIVFDNVVN